MPMLYPEPAQTLLYAYPISRGAITLTHLNGSRSSRHMRRRTDSSGSHHIPPAYRGDPLYYQPPPLRPASANLSTALVRFCRECQVQALTITCSVLSTIPNAGARANDRPWCTFSADTTLPPRNLARLLGLSATRSISPPPATANTAAIAQTDALTKTRQRDAQRRPIRAELRENRHAPATPELRKAGGNGHACRSAAKPVKPMTSIVTKAPARVTKDEDLRVFVSCGRPLRLRRHQRKQRKQRKGPPAACTTRALWARSSNSSDAVLARAVFVHPYANLFINRIPRTPGARACTRAPTLTPPHWPGSGCCFSYHPVSSAPSIPAPARCCFSLANAAGLKSDLAFERAWLRDLIRRYRGKAARLPPFSTTYTILVQYLRFLFVPCCSCSFVLLIRYIYNRLV